MKSAFYPFIYSICFHTYLLFFFLNFFLIFIVFHEIFICWKILNKQTSGYILFNYVLNCRHHCQEQQQQPVHWYTVINPNRQAGRQAGGLASRQADRQTVKHFTRHVSKQWHEKYLIWRSINRSFCFYCNHFPTLTLFVVILAQRFRKLFSIFFFYLFFFIFLEFSKTF